MQHAAAEISEALFPDTLHAARRRLQAALPLRARARARRRHRDRPAAAPEPARRSAVRLARAGPAAREGDVVRSRRCRRASASSSSRCRSRSTRFCEVGRRETQPTSEHSAHCSRTRCANSSSAASASRVPDGRLARQGAARAPAHELPRRRRGRARARRRARSRSRSKASSARPRSSRSARPSRASSATGCARGISATCPRRSRSRAAGASSPAIPALVDEGDSVAIRLFDVKQAADERDARRRAAAAAHRAQGADAPARERLAGLPPARRCSCAASANAEELQEDLIDAIADRAFIGDDALPRTQKAFEAQRARARTRLPAVTEAAMRLFAAIAEEYQRVVRAACVGQRPARAARRRHPRAAVAARLQGFLQRDAVGAARAPAALSRRRCRCGSTSTATARSATRSTPRASRSSRSATTSGCEKQRKAGVADPRLEEFRWHLEELRVSLFAQELKTPYPVSYKRLEKIWNGIRGI